MELITAIVVLITALITLSLAIRNRKHVNEIHVMVNSQRLELDKRINQLTSALADRGIVIPPREDLIDDQSE